MKPLLASLALTLALVTGILAGGAIVYVTHAEPEVRITAQSVVHQVSSGVWCASTLFGVTSGGVDAALPLWCGPEQNFDDFMGDWLD